MSTSGDTEDPKSAGMDPAQHREGDSHSEEISPPDSPLPEELESVFLDNIVGDKPRAWRSAPPSPSCERRGLSASMLSLHTEEFFDLLSTAQTRRLDEQRAFLPELVLKPKRHFSVPNYRQFSLPSDERGIVTELQRRRGGSWAGRSRRKKPPTIKIPAQEELYTTILGHQSQRLNDQRSSPPIPQAAADLFDILFRVQGSRMDEQRVELPATLKGACA
ncbi:G-protein-signaling modulator 3 [Rana temporaria]|uniref:G-protein-signaling modulator 3 n=1 Tax=Rana temporaria TaxID=8407 RepID=UPI001AACFB62|nr:G-protein-signaling modulator 3 [Rana temporaria]XP_040178969.1 G-protein-signaling modulator 3 [Rana temporaria]XP_040178970.1 G-protein-signaling modulator 3 [Rana temporaria]